MNKFRLNNTQQLEPISAEPEEDMASFVAKHRADNMPRIKVQDARVSKQREALKSANFRPVHRSA